MSDYNPSDYTVDEVKSYVAENPDQASAVLEAEKEGQNRSTLVSALEPTVSATPQAPEVPQNVAGRAVEVGLNPTPTRNTLLGNDYEVTAARGYRKV